MLYTPPRDRFMNLSTILYVVFENFMGWGGQVSLMSNESAQVCLHLPPQPTHPNYPPAQKFPLIPQAAHSATSLQQLILYV